ncbi:transglycosylase SLT domain-containing protein [Streptomyces sp. NBC_00257]|uniref:Transglycosylase SLT domain-containing protein n=2 Tax=Streptomyces TaxID=1883 RepID=A0ABW2X415_9ACTN|nr:MULTISPECIES: transglycosylase SLT domain-containing protein [Streptomyces]WSG50593.1 transglycosylase SLT domain-containing protein [Streptomyces sp. NBC_01732]WSW08063.1 transglycosylase SLT domain-containing protein [Streptomyces sp. NBC_01005]WSX01249.1 transglycosylase SLT domain-containing protein [Streptomyces sp. NBC_00987]WTB54127.1 transglycosylase SLT domain-containing protein [Streptomyces sp. NBC_00826]WTC97573.1 transglycosylase SLT domain-containing protein [Streptomyces sp. 
MSFARNILAKPRTARRKSAVAGAAVLLGATGLGLGVTPAMAAPAAAPTSVAGSAQATAKSMIGDAAQFQCFSNIVQHESGWNHTATNASSGAYGLVQALPGSKMASAGADWKTNPSTQIKWGMDYMNSRYGSPCGAWSFWQANHWY